MSKKILLRIFAAIILLVSVLFFPFWISVILGLIFIAYFSFFAEAIFIFLISDLLFGANEPKFFYFNGISFLIAIVVFTVAETIKKKLRFDV